MKLLAHNISRHLICFSLGAICVLGFAPFYVFPAAMLSLMCFFYVLANTQTTKAAAWSGFYYGLGLYAVGIYWIYISLHQFGGMPSAMAALATFLLCAFMASFTAILSALAVWLSRQSSLSTPRQHLILVITLALSWGLFDWIKSWIFTGFPWLTIGYIQVPNGPLAGLVPVLGIYGVSVVTVLTTGLMALFTQYSLAATKLKSKDRLQPIIKTAVFSLTALFAVALLFKQFSWTAPHGAPVKTTLLQGNIAQDLKWSPAIAEQTINLYRELALSSDAELIVFPETALPILSNQLNPTLTDALTAHAKQNNGNMILGIVEYDQDQQQYYNGALSFGINPTQHYEKNHLVPFGEFIPLKQVFGWVYRDWLKMPLSDMARGGTKQTPMTLGEQKVAINICYEDVFGEEIIRQLPEATMLVNITNDAWYGESYAAEQHLQFSQARALETGRTVLRATNTGATAMIDPKGQVLAHAANFTQASLDVSAQGYQGSTPYVRWGNWPFIIITISLLLLIAYRKNKRNHTD